METAIRYSRPSIQRFYSLDMARGIAAIAIVFWHWQHFFWNGTTIKVVNTLKLPFYDFFSLFYNSGWIAVDFFFSLSGFIFFWLYSQPINEKKVGGKEFFLLRFSRLYPLHFVTLLLVILFQQIYLNFNHTYFVYQNNDLYHFMLNVFFVSAWGFEQGTSFNAPIWSVSIELILYLMFFVLCRLNKANIRFLTILVLIGLTLKIDGSSIGRGLFSFFGGCLVYLAYQNIVKQNVVRLWSKIFVPLALGLWTLTLLDNQFGITPQILPLLKGSITGAITILFFERFVFSAGVLFPITILCLALVETEKGTLGKRVAFLGDLTYSFYLLHFPLQLVFVLSLNALGVGESIYYSNFLFISFMLCLFFLSRITYQFFERPMQKRIRNYFRNLEKKEKSVPHHITP